MITENSATRQSSSQLVGSQTEQGSYLDWSAILAGGFFALAVSFLLIGFGTSLGLSLTSPYRGEGVSAAWLAIASGIWFIWVIVSSFGAGGYLSGRLRRRIGDATAHEVEVRDGAHGLMVWAIGALVSILLATAGIGGLVSTGASAVGSAVGTATDVASEAASSDYFANLMLRSDVQSPDSEASAEGTETTTPPTEGDAQPAQPVRQAVTEFTEIDPAVQQQVASILARSATSGEMAERDRTYLAQVVAANTDMDADAALARVDEINTEIADARTAALETVEDARVAGVVFGFITVATLLIGAIAAAFAATAGGHHRDEGLGLNALTMRR